MVIYAEDKGRARIVTPSETPSPGFGEEAIMKLLELR